MSYNQMLVHLLLQVVLLPLIIGGVFIAARIAKRWRDVSVRDALRKYQKWEDHWKEEYRKQEEDAKKEKYTLQRKFAAIESEIGKLYCALHGKPLTQIEDEIACPPLPERSRPFWEELSALMRGLNLLQTPLEEGRVTESQLNAYHFWVEELWGRYLLQMLNKGNELLCCKGELIKLQKMYEEMSKVYAEASDNEIYQRFAGMIHLVEVFIDEGDVSSVSASSYIEALSKQMRRLVLLFATKEGKKRFSYSRWVLKNAPNSIPHLKPLLESVLSSL